MNRVFSVLAAFAVVVAAPTSHAQDPPREPPADIPWTGFYLGANAGVLREDDGRVFGAPDRVRGPGGGGWRGRRVLPNPLATVGDGKSKGMSAVLGGGQLGYNHRIGAVVVGIEGDIQVVSGSRDSESFATVSRVGRGLSTTVMTKAVSHSYDYLGTLRGRVGYLVMPDLLLFATGGLAFAERRDTIAVETTVATATAARSGTRTGYVVGGGLEYVLDQNWSVKGEAFHYDLGTTRSAGPVISPKGSGRPLGGAQVYATSQDRGIIGRIGLNYRFAGW